MFWHTATIIKRGKTLVIAKNTFGSRSRGSGWSDYSLHAERADVKRLGDISQLRGATLIVVRYNAHGQLSPSMPCPDCQLFLRKCFQVYGLRKVMYS